MAMDARTKERLVDELAKAWGDDTGDQLEACYREWKRIGLSQVEINLICNLALVKAESTPESGDCVLVQDI